jgi:hypothetical protein
MAFKIKKFISPLNIEEDKGKDKPSANKPTKKKVIKKTTKIKPSAKKKVKASLDRFANYRNDPRYTPVGFRPDGSVTMMDKNGHTFGMKRRD